MTLKKLELVTIQKQTCDHSIANLKPDQLATLYILLFIFY
jgi:hypothetical protein